jgi:hypothetical protein
VIDARWTKLFLAWTLATPENALDDYSPEYVVVLVAAPPPESRTSWALCIDSGVVVRHIPVDQFRFERDPAPVRAAGID